MTFKLGKLLQEQDKVQKIYTAMDKSVGEAANAKLHDDVISATERIASACDKSLQEATNLLDPYEVEIRENKLNIQRELPPLNARIHALLRENNNASTSNVSRILMIMQT